MPFSAAFSGGPIEGYDVHRNTREYIDFPLLLAAAPLKGGMGVGGLASNRDFPLLLAAAPLKGACASRIGGAHDAIFRCF